MPRAALIVERQLGDASGVTHERIAIALPSTSTVQAPQQRYIRIIDVHRNPFTIHCESFGNCHLDTSPRLFAIL